MLSGKIEDFGWFLMYNIIHSNSERNSWTFIHFNLKNGFSAIIEYMNTPFYSEADPLWLITLFVSFDSILLKTQLAARQFWLYYQQSTEYGIFCDSDISYDYIWGFFVDSGSIHVYNFQHNWEEMAAKLRRNGHTVCVRWPAYT